MSDTTEVGAKRGISQDEFESSKKLKGEDQLPPMPPQQGGFEDYGAAAGGDQDTTQSMYVRVLCDSKSVGGLIGKGGTVIKEMRSESGAHIDISDAVQGARKRVVTVRGNVDGVANALHLMADRMWTNRVTRGSRDAPQPNAGAGEEEEVFIDLLVPQCQIGGVIGKGGAKIKVTRESSGASVRISAEPLDESTEKSCTVKGSSEQVYKAIILVCYHLLENAEKVARQLYWPKPDGAAPFGNGGFGQQQQFGMAQGGGGFGQQQQQQQGFAGFGGPQQGFGGQQQQGYGGQQQQGFSGGRGGGGGFSAGGAQENVVIPIPDTLIGYVIGRAGTTIKEIRQQSRAMIKISDKQPGANERIITITGAQGANEIAVALINEKLSQHDVSYQQTA